MKGYENHEIVGYTETEILKIVNSGTNKELLEVAKRTQEFIHHSDTKTKKTKSYAVCLKWKNKLEVLVANLLRSKGFTMQTQEDYRKGINHENTDIHLFFDLCYYEHPTRAENNFSVDKVIFDSYGAFITKNELEKKLYADPEIKSICQDEFDDLNEEDKKLVKEFMKSENFTLADIHTIKEDEVYDCDGLRIEIGTQEYYILRDISDIDGKIIRELEDDTEYQYFYTDGINSGKINPIVTTYSDWIEQVVIMDGWESVVGTYDGSSTGLTGNACYFRRN